jgi:hypothetical protein
MIVTRRRWPLSSARSIGDKPCLVQGILQTLDQSDAAVDAEWREEVERRVDGAEAGDRPATRWSEARRKLGL